ncbi:MAG: aminoglycoside phosphotransferase, partial [Aestuariivirgaceae bacterium]|nr:aminoglycoside phosphotransferase [Aestuariivirgaceae bacterium]
MTDLTLLSRFAHAALAHYELEADVSLELINLSENATYRVQSRCGKRWALRVHREGYHSHAAIASELSWLMALRSEGVVTTPVPLPGRDGELIQLVTVDGHSRHAVLSAWEEGREPGVGEDLSAHFATLGGVTARMHLHAKAWQRPAGFTRHV